MYGRTSLALFAFLLFGCDAPPMPEDAAAPTAADLFDAATAGTIRGRVVWSGPIPDVPDLVQRPLGVVPDSARPTRRWPNPHAPRIDPATRGVGGAVVYLRGVDVRRARPWDHPPVQVELRGEQIHVLQGEADAMTGFVRRGAAVTLTSRDAVFHALHAGGAAYFTLPFPDPDRPRTRRLTEPGVVELTSASGAFWMRGHLFVAEHPYLARCDAAGTFVLTGVPPGSYEVVCWLPDWRIAGHARDPESPVVTRLFFRPPWEETRPVTLAPQGTVEVVFAGPSRARSAAE